MPCRGGTRGKLPLLSLPLQDCDRLQGNPLTNVWPAPLPGQWTIIPAIPMPSWRFFNGLQTSGEPTPSQCYDSLLAIHHSLQFFVFFKHPSMPHLTSFNLVVLRGWQQQNWKERGRGEREAAMQVDQVSGVDRKKSWGEWLGDGRIDRWKGKERKTWSQKWHLLKAIHLSAMRDDAIMVMCPTAAVPNQWVATQKWVAGQFWQGLDSMKMKNCDNSKWQLTK